MPLRIENPEAARFRAQSAELWRTQQTGGGASYHNPATYAHATLPCMVREDTYKSVSHILKAGKPLFYNRFPGGGSFNRATVSESPCNLSLLDTLSVQREWCVAEHQDVMKWTIGKRFAIRHKKFERSSLRPSQVTDGVSKVDTQCDRDQEFLRFPVHTSAEQQRIAEVAEALDHEVDVICGSTSKHIGDTRNPPLASQASTCSPVQGHRPGDSTQHSAAQRSTRAFQTPGLCDRDAHSTGFSVASSGLPFINFGADSFSIPKHRRPLPEVGFNKFGAVGNKTSTTAVGSKSRSRPSTGGRSRARSRSTMA